MELRIIGKPATRQTIYNTLKRWLKKCDCVETNWQDCNNYQLVESMRYTPNDLDALKDKVMNLTTGLTFYVYGDVDDFYDGNGHLIEGYYKYDQVYEVVD